MIAYYARVSSAEQAENGYSIEEQKERMEKYCDAMGWSSRQNYTDPGFTGATIDRPAMQRLIKDVKAGKIEKVLVYKLDRLSRSQKDTLYLIEDVFLANGCDFVSMSENFDTSSPFGRAMIGILAVFAQLEREQIKERMMMGKQARAKQGKFNGSACPPIGYDYDSEIGELVVNPFESIQIVKIFEMFSQGKSVKSIADKLNDDGYTHKYGTWNDVSVRRVLTRKTYIGYNYSKGEWYKAEHEPIVSKEIFDSVQTIVERIHLEELAHGRRRGKANSYLGGYLYCAQCGNRYSKKSTDHSKWVYYACNSRYKRKMLAKGRVCHNKTWHLSELEELVFGEMRKLALEENQPSKHTDNRPKSIEKKLSEIDKQVERLIDLYASGNGSQDKIQAKIKALNEQRTTLNHELGQIIEEEKDRMSRADIVKAANSLDAVLDHGDYDEIRAVIGALIDKIEIDNDNVTIYWTFS